MSHEYDYPDDTPTREQIEQAEADRDPPECICEKPQGGLYNPDCYWHGTETDPPSAPLPEGAPAKEPAK